VYGKYFSVSLLAFVNYASVFLAAVIFVLIMNKYARYGKELNSASAKA